MKKNEIFGSAKWVGTNNETNTPYIRSVFEIKDKGEAKIYICGLGFFYLYINGKPVSNDIFAPVRSDYIKRKIDVEGKPFDEEMNHRVYALEYDITPFIKEGENDLSVELGPGFFDNEAWSYDHPVRFGDVRLIYRIVHNSSKGDVCEICSSGDEVYHKSPVIFSHMYKGEEIDFANSPCADFPQGSTKGWDKVSTLDDLDTEYYIQKCPNDKVIRTIEPVQVAKFGPVRVYDIGENTTGWVVIKCTGQKGDKAFVRFAEELNSTGGLNRYFIHNQVFTVTMDDCTRIVRPRFVWYGFRYFSIEGNCEPVCAEVIHTDVKTNLIYDSSNPTLNWIYDAFVRTQLANMHSGVPSDCPHIERRGYTGDGQLCARASMQILDAKEFYYKWIDDILDCQDRTTGHVQYTAPYQRCGGGPGGWGCAIVTVPYEYYLRYGDKTVLEKAYPQMLKYLEYLKNHSEDGLVTSDRKGSWCLGDWCVPHEKKIRSDYVNTYFRIKSLQIVEKIENILGYEHFDKDGKEKDEVIKAFNSHFYNPETCSYDDGVNGADAFALDIGLGNEKTLENLKSKYKSLGEYDTGIFGTEVLTRVLFEKGEDEIAYKLLTSDHDLSFETFRKVGATTFWEYWPQEYERSHSHPMFGAVAENILSYIAGIRMKENTTGYTDIVINPRCVPYLENMDCSFLNEKGQFSVKYTKSDKTEFEITIPEGTCAVFEYGDFSQELHTGKNEFKI